LVDDSDAPDITTEQLTSPFRVQLIAPQKPFSDGIGLPRSALKRVMEPPGFLAARRNCQERRQEKLAKPILTGSGSHETLHAGA